MQFEEYTHTNIYLYIHVQLLDFQEQTNIHMHLPITILKPSYVHVRNNVMN